MSISALRYKNVLTLDEAASLIADDNSSIESIISLLREKVGDGTIAAVRLVRFGRYDWDLGTNVYNSNCTINHMETTIARDVLVNWLTQIGYQPKPKLLFPDTTDSVKPQPLPPANAAPEPNTRTIAAMEPPVPQLKKAALVKKYQYQWPTAQVDIDANSRNGLSVAKIKRGFYDEAKAVQWAKERGKYKENTLAAKENSIFDSPTSVKKRCAQ